MLADTFSIPTALAFLTVQMLFVPCVATVAVIRQETGSWRWTFFDLVFLLVVSLAAGTAVHWASQLAAL
jgi:ferrous iron transport protein B